LAAWRHDVGWTAIVALVLQILLTTAHFHLGCQGWSGPSVPLYLAPFPAGHPGAAAPPATPAPHHQPVSHPDCPICQTVPIVSASLAPATIELERVAAGTPSAVPTTRNEAKRVERAFQAQPRAPPTEA
jgi:hypothetical protein